MPRCSVRSDIQSAPPMAPRESALPLGGRVYSPVEICRVFGVPKSTLLWWESHDPPLIPPARRGRRRGRLYDKSHLVAIRQLQGSQAAASGDVNEWRKSVERKNASLLLDAPGDGIHALREWISSYGLSEPVFQLVLDFMRTLGPDDLRREELLRILADADKHGRRAATKSA